MIVSGKSSFAPHPDGGPFSAVCVDVVDMQQVPTQYGPKDKVRIVFETDQTMPEDDHGRTRPFIISAFFTATIGEKSNLRKFLKQWRGVDFTKEELSGFDLEKLVGVNARIVVTQVQEGPEVYSNITAIMRGDPTKRMKASGFYTRVRDRQKDGKPATQPQDKADSPEDNIPF